jgi:CheY-like chemotaxis protein
VTSDGPLVLAVEDDARNAALLRATLERAGYRLAVARSLADARAWLGAARPDLVLLDIGLPDGSGLELASELRAHAATAELPIIVTSARVMPGDRERAARAGCDAFLAKPLRPAELLRAVAQRVGTRPSGDE